MCLGARYVAHLILFFCSHSRNSLSSPFLNFKCLDWNSLYVAICCERYDYFFIFNQLFVRYFAWSVFDNASSTVVTKVASDLNQFAFYLCKNSKDIFNERFKFVNFIG